LPSQSLRGVPKQRIKIIKMNIFEIESLLKEEYVTKVIIVMKINRIDTIFRKLKLNVKKR
jgi:hypothetical protein